MAPQDIHNRYNELHVIARQRATGGCGGRTTQR